MARPNSSDPKSRYVRCRVTKEELTRIEQMVKDTGSANVSEFLYNTIFNGSKQLKKVVALPPDQLKNLINIGSNINQIAKVLNTVSNPHLTTNDKLRLKAMHDDVRKILEAVNFMKL